MSDVTLTPAVWFSIRGDTVSGILLAGNLNDLLHRFVIAITVNQCWLPVSTLIGITNLTISIETPRVKLALLRKCNGMTITSSASLNEIIVRELDLCGSSDLTVSANTELTHFGLAPTEHFALVSDSE